MIDIYALIAVGTALGLGIIPLFKQIKTIDNDFLISYHIDKVKFKEYLVQLHKDGDWIE